MSSWVALCDWKQSNTLDQTVQTFQTVLIKLDHKYIFVDFTTVQCKHRKDDSGWFSSQQVPQPADLNLYMLAFIIWLALFWLRLVVLNQRSHGLLSSLLHLSRQLASFISGIYQEMFKNKLWDISVPAHCCNSLKHSTFRRRKWECWVVRAATLWREQFCTVWTRIML